jgi:hypothetical protein
MRRSNAVARSILVVGFGAGIATAIACTGGPATGDGDLLGGSSGISSSSGSSGPSSSSSSSSGSSGSTIVQDTFSHACNSDDDCTLALLNSSTCSFCSSQNAAIAKSEESAYQIAYNQARANCPANGAVGTCARFYSVSKCGASKTCQLITCGSTPSVDEHHCTATDGG